MNKEHFKMAFHSVQSSRMRSSLTMFGIIIGVASVVTIVGLGRGLRNQVSGQINKLGSNLIIVQPGKHTSRAFNLDALQNIGGTSIGILTEQDLSSIGKVKGLSGVVPVATINGLPHYEDKKMNEAIIVGTTEKLPALLNKKIEYGSFFAEGDQSKPYAVIGHGVAEKLFGENVPIGKSFKIKETEFIVQGVFAQTPLTALSPSVNFNNAVVIPFAKAKEISAGSLQINQIFVTSEKAESSVETAKSLTTLLLANHGGQQDFSVLRQEETTAITDGVFSQLTLFVTGAAIISLLVAGIGIMNIMFANVSERTREIGIRKAIGATNRQIVGQFLAEAIVISVSGGIIGVIVSLLIISGLRATTSLEPAISVPTIIIATLVSIATGIISGILPAIKAARKDPIESLRGF